MIEYITGEVTDLTPATAVVECMGIGYLLNISLNTYSCLSKGQATRLYVYEAIREDAYQLYGFYDRHERELFILLISVSGVGPNTARMILSSLNPSELEQAIVSENLNLLKSVKGIGAKTAQLLFQSLSVFSFDTPTQIPAFTQKATTPVSEHFQSLLNYLFNSHRRSITQ